MDKTILVNDEERRIDEHQAWLSEILVQEGVQPDQAGVAVAINCRIIAAHLWAQTVVQEGDHVSIVHAVYGG